MAALATVDDLATRLGRVISDEDQAEALLEDASAAVRSYTGQTFTLVEDDTVRLRASGSGVRLPQRPVVDVTAVENVSGGSVAFIWDAGDSVTLAGLTDLYNFEVVPYTTRQPWVDVTYSHGYETVPDDIVGVVCQIAGRALGRPADASGVTQESIAGYSYSVGSAAASGAFGMLAGEREILDKYRRPLGTIRVAS